MGSVHRFVMQAELAMNYLVPNGDRRVIDVDGLVGGQRAHLALSS
jgi:hypothetical protein